MPVLEAEGSVRVGLARFELSQALFSASEPKPTAPEAMTLRA